MFAIFDLQKVFLHIVCALFMVSPVLDYELDSLRLITVSGTDY
jgi:hypothetical protein